MSRDTDMAKDLVAKLQALTFTQKVTVKHGREIPKEVAEIDAAQVFVSGSISYNRIARGFWSPDVELAVTCLSDCKIGLIEDEPANQNEIDSWLAFVDDELIAPIQDMKILGKLPRTITFPSDESRLGRYTLRTNDVFYSRFVVGFNFAG